MATSEIIINEYLGAELRRFHPRWQANGVVLCESTEAFFAKSLRPDLVISDNPLAPVGIETEFAPANTVESDAIGRLGKIFVPTGGKIHSVFAVRLPTKYRQLKGADIAENLRQELELEYCLVYGSSAADHSRWPSMGYITGSASDLAYVVSAAKTSPVMVELGATFLEEGAKRLAAMLASTAKHNPHLGDKIAEQLKQEAGPQTYTMAATILINAFVFQETIAGTCTERADVKSIYAYGKGNIKPTKMEVIEAWNQILAVNYWAIFGVSKALVAAVPAALWAPFIKVCLTTADQLLSLNLGKNPDLVGTIFQRLIFDRRFLATFYTAPSSAALLARIMIEPHMPDGSDWSDAHKVQQLKIADFACGTGSLLCALYSELQRRIESAGVDSECVHASMVEESLFGCDVIPSATYITASQISSAHPSIRYKDTKILTMPFGRVENGSVALGSLDLLETQGAFSTISTSAGGIGAQSGKEVDPWHTLGGTAVKDQSFDYVAMNPPFTRLTGGGGKSASVSRPLFAAFGTNEADQSDMAKKATKLFKDSAYHGNAGAASAFVELSHRKLKEKGRVGLILPLSALSGASWQKCRDLWRKHYRNIVVLSIASQEAGSSAFSADTGVSECMIVATRCDGSPDKSLVSVTLYRRPDSILEGAEIARIVRSLTSSGSVQTLENGPLGGTSIFIGGEKVGEAITCPIVAGAWHVSCIRDHALAQVAYQLAEKLLWLPGSLSATLTAGPLCRLGELGEAGPYHLDVSSSALSGGAPRGPFKLVKTAHPGTVTFPVLKAHDERRERYIEIAPDAEGIARKSSNKKASEILDKRRAAVWNARTKLHFATDTQFNSNALIACLTTREAIGGRAWPSFILKDRRYEKAIVLWFNSTLGILAFWWLSNKIQDGRGSVTTTRLQNLTCFDPRTLSSSDLDEVDSFFDIFKSKPLLDIHECAEDANRAELDQFVTARLLKAPGKVSDIEEGLQLLRAKLVVEPSISGGGHDAIGEDEEEA